MRRPFIVNTFALLQRGYQVEPLTTEEYRHLRHLFEGLAQPGIDALDLYDTGGHRELYCYLTQGLGLTVWDAKRIITGFEQVGGKRVM
jgi:hypothetical protein